MASGCDRLQHGTQLADRGLPDSDVGRLEQADREAGQVEGQELRQPGGSRRQRALLHRRRRQRPNVVLQSFTRCMEAPLC